MPIKKELFLIFFVFVFSCSDEQISNEEEVPCEGFLSDNVKAFADLNWSLNNWVSNWLVQPDGAFGDNNFLWEEYPELTNLKGDYSLTLVLTGELRDNYGSYVSSDSLESYPYWASNPSVSVLRDSLFYEYKAETIARDEVDWIEHEIEALNLAKSLDIDTAEAIVRIEVGSEVSSMSSKELKRDLLLFAKRDPILFLELASDDNVQLRNFGIKAAEQGIIKLSGDQRHFIWSSNNRKIMTVPFDEHPYSALAHWFKTDEGMEIYSNIQKRLS